MEQFFLGSPIALAVGAAGSSLTYSVEGATVLQYWATHVRQWILQNQFKYNVTWKTQAWSGHWPWSNLIRYPAGIATITPDIVLMDFRSVDTGLWESSSEALIRKIWTANPNAVIISPIFPVCVDHDVDVVSDQTAIELADIATANYYGVHLVDYRQEVIDRVADGEHLNVYMADPIHATPTGYALIGTMVEAAILANGWLNEEDHSTLPARLYDTGGYYETAGVHRILGNANSGTTGTWTTTGSRIESSEEGATVTFVATCKSFGLYYDAETYNTVADVQVDGGDWQTNVLIDHNGHVFTGLTGASHTIVIRVRAGAAIRIDEFWAI